VDLPERAKGAVKIGRWLTGPPRVQPSIYESTLRAGGRKRISSRSLLPQRVSIADVDTESKSEIEALDFAYSEFGGKSASTLVNITHRYPEWDKFKRALESKETTRETMSYADFFKNPSNGAEDKFALSADVLGASQELFEEDYKVAEYWK
jgi:uncharacterized phage-associated protein